MPNSTGIACLACFSNHGFRLVAEKYAYDHQGSCPQCSIDSSHKLDVVALRQAMIDFFVTGSYLVETYASAYQVNDSNPNSARFDKTLSRDAALSSRLTGLVVFDYGPPMWRFGATNHYYAFEDGGARRKQAAQSVISAAKKTDIRPGTMLYRVRLNPIADESIVTPSVFDPPPSNIKREAGRWDDLKSSVLYVADDIELCLHECRTTISDEIVVATLSPTRTLKVIDLSSPIEETGPTPFDDQNVFVGIMCRSRGRWLDYCREISREALAAGYDGIRYASYYAQSKHDYKSLNLAIFGRPLQDGVLELKSVNRLRITDMTYKYDFGPVLYRDSAMQSEIERPLGKTSSEMS